jgi:hypothetical protein
MHIEKGVFKRTIRLLLDIPSKTKDGLSVLKDLQALEIREELHPQERSNEKAYLPLALKKLHPHNWGEKGILQVSGRDQSPHRILNKHKKSGLHVRTENEWL